MLEGFKAMLDQEKMLKERIKFAKVLGWSEFDEEGDKHPVRVVCLDVLYGYNILRFGKETRFIGWHTHMDTAVEEAVDYCRREIAQHEFEQQKKEIIGN